MVRMKVSSGWMLTALVFRAEDEERNERLEAGTCPSR